MSPRPIDRVIVALWIVLLSSPWLAVLFHVGEFSLPEISVVAPVLARTVVQAFFAALFSLFAGLLATLGLFWLESKKGERTTRFIEIFFLLPNMVPSFVIVLSIFKFFPHLRGLEGIVLAHTMMNVGLVALSFRRLASERLGRLAELVYIEGATGWMFLKTGVLQYLKSDLLAIAGFVFALSFTSLSIPLLFGGSQATTLELLIFQKLRISSDWGEATSLAVLQMVFLLLILSLWNRSPSAKAQAATSIPILHFPLGLVFGLAPTLMVIGAMLSGWVSGWNELLSLNIPLTEWMRLTLGSTFIGIAAGALALVLLLLLAAFPPPEWARRLLIGYVAPSATLTGFGLLLLWQTSGEASLVKIALGVVLMSLPACYRLQWDGAIESLAGQRETAWLLGAQRRQIFFEITLPQVWKLACTQAGFVTIWAWSDFALSSVVAERSWSLSMLAQNLLGSYRLDAATLVMWMVIMGAVISYLFFWSVGHVARGSVKN